jgi:hypothetical protein
MLWAEATDPEGGTRSELPGAWPPRHGRYPALRATTPGSNFAALHEKEAPPLANEMPPIFTTPGALLAELKREPADA